MPQLGGIHGITTDKCIRTRYYFHRHKLAKTHGSVLRNRHLRICSYSFFLYHKMLSQYVFMHITMENTRHKALTRTIHCDRTMPNYCSRRNNSFRSLVRRAFSITIILHLHWLWFEAATGGSFST